MGDKPEIPSSWRTAAHFHYQAASDKVYEIEGSWQEERGGDRSDGPAYGLDVQLVGSRQGGLQRLFYVTRVLYRELKTEAESRGDNVCGIRCVRQLRRLALDVTMEELHADRQTQDEFAVGIEQRDLLDRFAFRACQFQQALTNGDLVCTAGADGDCATTRAICEACGMPDPWERCEHITHVRTQAVTSDSIEGVLTLLCDAQCMLGRSPGGEGIPLLCRAGANAPDCFEPPVIARPPPERPIGFRPAR